MVSGPMPCLLHPASCHFVGLTLWFQPLSVQCQFRFVIRSCVDFSSDLCIPPLPHNAIVCFCSRVLFFMAMLSLVLAFNTRWGQRTERPTDEQTDRRTDGHQDHRRSSMGLILVYSNLLTRRDVIPLPDYPRMPGLNADMCGQPGGEITSDALASRKLASAACSWQTGKLASWQEQKAKLSLTVEYL